MDLFDSMQQGKMFFMMGLCMAFVQGGYVRRIPHGKEINTAITVSTDVATLRLANTMMMRSFFFFSSCHHYLLTRH